MPIDVRKLYKKFYQDNIILNRFAKVLSLDILVKGSSFLLLPIYLKLMTQEEFGLFTYIYSMITTFSLLLNFLYIAQSKYFHDFKGERRQSLLFTINVLLSIIVFGSLLIVYFTKSDYFIIQYIFTKPIPYNAYRETLFLGLIITVYGFILNNYFLTSENIGLVQKYNYLKLILENGVVIILLVFLPGDKVLIRLATFYGVNGFIFICFVYFYIKAMRIHFDFHLAKKSLYISIPIFASSVFGIFYNFSDKFIIEKYADFKQMAVYNLGFIISSIIPVFIASFQGIWLPLFFKEKNIDKNIKKTNRAMIAIFLTLVVIDILIIILIKLAIFLHIIGAEYATVIHIIPVQLFAQTIIAIIALYKNYFIYFERVYLVTIINIITSLFILTFNLLLIPKYGIVGASLSMFCISIIESVIVIIVIRSLIHKARSHSTLKS